MFMSLRFRKNTYNKGMEIQFDGQQSGERILYTITPHPLSKYLAITRTIVLAFVFPIILFMIAGIIPQTATFLRIFGTMLSLILIGAGIWWNMIVYSKSKTFITDRRVIRFDVVSPFFMTKRALFWNEVLKAKAYAPNMFFRLFKVGVVMVEPLMSDHEDVTIPHVYYFEDLANYIDKILYTFKNKPEDIVTIKPFIPLPKGKRD